MEALQSSVGLQGHAIKAKHHLPQVVLMLMPTFDVWALKNQKKSVIFDLLERP